jgi:hypothetical protein
MRLALILLSLLIFPLPSPAQETPPAAPAPANSAGISAEEIEEWRQTLFEARERVDKAQEDVAVTQQAFRKARQRNRRGDERGELLATLQAAEQDLEEAEAALPLLLDQARRAGVPPGILREFES